MESSVVIPTFNRAALLEQTLSALASQVGRPEPKSADGDPHSAGRYEVIVVDDGSKDPPPDLVRRMSKDYPVPLHYLRQNNRKQGAARNLGARKAAGGLLIFLGDDTVPAPEFLQWHRSSHTGQPAHRVVIGYTPWARACPRTRFMEYIGERGWQFGFSLIEDPENVPFNFFYTSNLSMRRDFFWEAGGFDEDFHEYGWEDIELSLRLYKMGMKLAYNPQAIAYHHHPTSLLSFAQRQKKVGRSAWIFYRKHPDMGEFLSLDSPPRYTRWKGTKLTLLTWLCGVTEKWIWPDLSGYYPDLMSYHYYLGLRKGCHERLGS